MTLTDEEWQARASKLLRTQLFANDMSYKELARRLEALGVHYDSRALSNRVNRGTFSCVFFLQCLIALGIDTIEVPRDLLSIGDSNLPG